MLGEYTIASCCFLVSQINFGYFPCISSYVTVLQIRRGNRDNLPYFSIKTLCSDPSLEPSQRDGSKGGSQHMFSLRHRENYLCIIFNTLLSGALCKLWDTTERMFSASVN